MRYQKFFIMKVVMHNYRLPTEALYASPLELFETRLDGALSNLVQWKMFGTRWYSSRNII